MDSAVIAHRPAAAASPPGASRPWWESRSFVAAMILLAFVPLIYPQVPPLVDLPGHMGRYRVQLHLATSPELQRFYAFEWQVIGNLGVDLLVIPLSKLFGLELAVKLIVMSIPPLTVAGFLWVAREVHNRLPPTAAFALPFALGHPFLFGFVNFTLAMALAFLAFGLWLRLGRLGMTRLRAALFVPISFVLFVCHTFGWGTLGLLAFSAETVRQHDRGVGWWRAGLKAALHAAVMAGPILLMLAWREGGAPGQTADLFNMQAKFVWLLMVLRDRWQPLDIAMLVVVVIVLVEAIRRRELTYSRNLAFSVLVLLAVFLLLPRIIFGSAYADMRLLPFILATALLAIRFRDRTDLQVARQLAIAGVAFFVIKVAATTASLAIAADEQATRLEALDHVPKGAALVSLVGEGCDTPRPLLRHSHLPGLAIVRRHAFSNDQWAIAGANLLRVTYAGAGRFRADPSQMVRPNDCGIRDARPVDQALRLIPRDGFTHVWTIDLPPHDPTALDGYRLAWSNGPSRLYERTGTAR